MKKITEIDWEVYKNQPLHLKRTSKNLSIKEINSLINRLSFLKLEDLDTALESLNSINIKFISDDIKLKLSAIELKNIDGLKIYVTLLRFLLSKIPSLLLELKKTVHRISMDDDLIFLKRKGQYSLIEKVDSPYILAAYIELSIAGFDDFKKTEFLLKNIKKFRTTKYDTFLFRPI